jgi:triosephosphate isomerase
MTRKSIVVGNWKMNGSKQQMKAFFAAFKAKMQENPFPLCETVICPPAIYLPYMEEILTASAEIKLGAQDVSGFEKGAYTGQISAAMLLEYGCHYAIIGHSERRQFCQEDEETIAKKFFMAKSAGLTPILCVGETQEQRHSKLTGTVVLGQLQAILSAEGAEAFHGAIIAYEPVWAIGTGLTATPEQAQEVHGLLRQTIAEYDANLAQDLPILYGGSVKANNAKALFSMQDIDGALVGGASLDPQELVAICSAASNIN